MNEIYLISDTHFWHKNVISYCERPFNSVEEMNETMINNWNSVIGTNDIVYHLGDIAFCGSIKLSDILSRLNGKIKHIPGNHDDKNVLKICSRFHEIITESNFNIVYNKYTIYMSHKHMQHYTGKNIYHFHGHEHGTDLQKQYPYMTRAEILKSFNEYKWFGLKDNAIEVCVDLWNYTPVHIDTVLDKLVYDTCI